MCLFLNAAQRQTSGLTACADPSTQVCNAAEHRPAVAKNRDIARQAGTTMTPAHRVRAASGQASCSLIQSAAVSTCCPLLFTERGHLCGIPMPLSPSRRSPRTATPRGRPPRRRNVTTSAYRERSPYARALQSRGLGRTRRHCESVWRQEYGKR